MNSPPEPGQRYSNITSLFDLSVLRNPRIINRLNDYYSLRPFYVNGIRCIKEWRLNDVRDSLYMNLINTQTREQIGHVSLHFGGLGLWPSHIRSQIGINTVNLRPTRNIQLIEDYLRNITVEYTDEHFYHINVDVNLGTRVRQNINNVPEIHRTIIETSRRFAETGLSNLVDSTRTAIRNLHRDARAVLRTTQQIDRQATEINNTFQNIETISRNYILLKRHVTDATLSLDKVVEKINSINKEITEAYMIMSKDQLDGIKEKLGVNSQIINKLKTEGYLKIKDIPRLDTVIDTIVQNATRIRDNVTASIARVTSDIAHIEYKTVSANNQEEQKLAILHDHEIEINQQAQNINQLKQEAITVERSLNELVEQINNSADTQLEEIIKLAIPIEKYKNMKNTIIKRRLEEKQPRTTTLSQPQTTVQTQSQTVEEQKTDNTQLNKKQKIGGGVNNDYKNISIKNIPTENFLVNLLASNAYITIYKLYMNTFESYESYNIDFKELQNNPQEDLFSILLPELLELAKKYVSGKMIEYEKEIMDEIKNKKKINIFTIDYLSYVSQPKDMKTNISHDNDQNIDYGKKYLKYKYKYLKIKNISNLHSN
jgi:hypothetical protein